MEQDAFERIDVESPGCDPVQLRLHLARYRFAQQFVRRKRVLDIACGTGYGTAMLADDGAKDVVGVDLDESALDHARQKFSRPTVTFATGNAEDPPVAGPFDLVTSFETIEHLNRPDRFLNSMVRLLSNDGTLIVSTPCRQAGSLTDRPQNPFHVREWDQTEFAEFLSGYFFQVGFFGQLIEFAKGRLPFSRTLARLATSISTPRRLDKLRSCEVVGLDNLPWFRLRIAYLVAVCREPRKQS